MNKPYLVDRLRWFAVNKGVGLPDEYGHPDYRASRGEALLAGLLACWIGESVPDHDDLVNFSSYLPGVVVEAYAALSTEPRWEEARRAYRDLTGRDIPDLVDAHAGGIHRALVAHDVCRLLPLLTREEWLRGALESTLGAQMQVVDHAWRRFVRRAYRELMPRIRDEAHRGNSGRFGSTTLLTYDIAGRVMFTFRRGTGDVTYVADAGDMYGWRSGPNTLGAPYAECVSMIEEVVERWDLGVMRQCDTVVWGRFMGISEGCPRCDSDTVVVVGGRS